MRRVYFQYFVQSLPSRSSASQTSCGQPAECCVLGSALMFGGSQISCIGVCSGAGWIVNCLSG